MIWGKKGLVVVTVALAATVTFKPAKAADLPIEVMAEIPRSASIANWDGLFSWVEASRQSVNLSQFNSGQLLPAQILTPSWAPPRSTDLVTDGYGLRGAVGLIIPSGTFSKLNSDLRVQVETSYVNARSSDSVGSEFLMSDPISERCGCNAIVSAITATTPAASYQSWQGELKAATDLSFGRVVVTPSMSLFSKDARSYQNLFDGAANSAWADWGAKIGIDTTVEISNRTLLGFRGSVGTAYRAVSFAQGATADFASSGASAIGRPLLAASEVNLIWKPQVWQTIKAYAGIQFDSRVPNTPDPYAIDPNTAGAVTFQTVQSFYFGGSFKLEYGSDAATRF
jgi:hypothetical protein